MALLTETKDRKREPLGGREVNGFGQWLRVTTQASKEADGDLRERLPLGSPMRYVAIGASRHYERVLDAWGDVEREGSDPGARDRFEVELIAGVMSAYGAAEYARSQGYGPSDTTGGGRPVADIAAEYLRACIILAKYAGVSDLDVAKCRDDQAALMALRGDRG